MYKLFRLLLCLGVSTDVVTWRPKKADGRLAADSVLSAACKQIRLLLKQEVSDDAS
jgi:hypothetical protein